MTCPMCKSARVLGVEFQGEWDGALCYGCNDCGYAFHRFPAGDPLRARAEPFVDAANARRTG